MSLQQTVYKTGYKCNTILSLLEILEFNKINKNMKYLVHTMPPVFMLQHAMSYTQILGMYLENIISIVCFFDHIPDLSLEKRLIIFEKYLIELFIIIIL